MNKRFSNLDLMIFAASELYVESELQSLITVDTSDIEPFLKKRYQIHRTANHPQKSGWGYLKMFVAACLVCLSMAFTACVCIPEIRTVIWDVVVNWYDDHIGIYFKQEQPIGSAEPVKVDPPKEIEHKAYPSYLPGAYRCEIDLESTGMYMVSYYDLNTGEWSFMIQQSIIQEREQFADNENQKVETIALDDFEAIIVTSIDQPGFYCLVWQDTMYTYMINGYFESVDDIVLIAKGIQFQ